MTVGIIAFGMFVFGAASIQFLQAQPAAPAGAVPGTKPIDLVMHEVSGVQGKDFIVTTNNIPAGGEAPAHTHPGDAYHYVLSGQWDAVVDGKPMTFKSGEGLFAPRGQVHGGKFPQATKLLTFYILDKGWPRVAPVK